MTNCIANDQRSALTQQAINSYIDNKKQLYNAIINFLENLDEEYFGRNCEVCFNVLANIVTDQHIDSDIEEMQQFLRIIKNICDNHYRDESFTKRVDKIFDFFKYKIKQTLSNTEIFQIFENSKYLLLFLLKNEVITITDTIYDKMMSTVDPKGFRLCHFFIPEIEKFIGEEKMKEIKNELLSKDPNFFNDYENKRTVGENDSYICSLIRNDSVEEFISYVNHTSYSLSSKIEPSLFETNRFLIERKSTTLIEYSAFFGSIQIFQFLLMSNVKLPPSLWLYVIHSKNGELIHLLESNNVSPPKYSKITKRKEKKYLFRKKNKESENTNYIGCFVEAIKCHHNDIAEYIENNLLQRIEDDSKQIEVVVSNQLKYYNYGLFRSDDIINHGFFYLCFYNYNKLVNLFLKEKKDEIESKIIPKSNNLIKK